MKRLLPFISLLCIIPCCAALNNATLNNATLSVQSSPFYGYVQSHTITGSSDSTLTDYQMLITVHDGNIADSSQDVYVGSYHNKDFSDIGFLDSDKSTPLDYYMLSGDETEATFIVKIPTIPQSGTATIYIEYGDATDITDESSFNTFLFAENGMAHNYAKLDNDGATEVAGTMVAIRPWYHMKESEGKTFFMYMESDGGADFAENLVIFNNVTKRVERIIRNIARSKAKDNHRIADVFIDESGGVNDGRLGLVYGAHNSQLYYTHSTNDTYTGWLSEESAIIPDSSNDAYPQGCVDTAGETYVFSRSGDSGLGSNQEKAVIHKRDAGGNWTTTDLIDWNRANISDPRIYPWIVCDGDDMHVAFSVRSGDNNYDARTFYHALYFRYDMGDDKVYKADGTELTPPIDHTDGEFVVTGSTNYVFSISLDNTGVPIIIYGDATGDAIPWDPIWKIKLASYENQWVYSQITDGYNAQWGQMGINENGDKRVYVLKDVDAIDEIFMLESTDNVNWTSTQLTAESSTTNMGPITIARASYYPEIIAYNNEQNVYIRDGVENWNTNDNAWTITVGAGVEVEEWATGIYIDTMRDVDARARTAIAPAPASWKLLMTYDLISENNDNPMFNVCINTDDETYNTFINNAGSDGICWGQFGYGASKARHVDGTDVTAGGALQDLTAPSQKFISLKRIDGDSISATMHNDLSRRIINGSEQVTNDTELSLILDNLQVMGWDLDGNAGHIKAVIGDIYLLKSTANEPTHGTWGDPELK